MNNEKGKNSKLIDVRKYYDSTLNRLSSSEEQWKAFLACEGKFVHYPFDVQLMIYAQRPEATACATYYQWQQLNCVPRRGSKGIPYVDYSKGNPRLQHLFDIADIVSKDQMPLPKLWQFPKEESYVSQLTDNDSEESKEVKLWNHIKDYIDWEETEALLRQINNDDSEILSKEVDDLQDFFHASVSYAVFSRCGLNLEVCDKLNESLLMNNMYSIQSLDRNGIYIVADGISKFSKPVYDAIKGHIKTFENDQTNTEPIYEQAAESAPIDEKDYSKEAKPYEQLKLPVYESAPEMLSIDATVETVPLGTWTNPIEGGVIPSAFLQQELKSGTGFAGGKFRIEKLYTEGETLNASDRAKAIQKEYGSGGHGFMPAENYEGIFNSDTHKGKLSIEWKVKDTCYKGEVSWNDVEKHIHELLREHSYISEDERLNYLKTTAFDEAIRSPHGFLKLNGHMIEFKREGALWTSPLAEIVLPEPLEEISEALSTQIAEVSYAVELLDRTVLNVDEKYLFNRSEDFVIFVPGDGGQLKQIYSAEDFSQREPIAAVEHYEKVDTAVIEIPSPGNYQIKDLHLNDDGGAKIKFRQNVEAIKVLKTIEADQRYATHEEQAVLAGFVGWGGLADVFDPSKDAWASEYQDLHDLLTKREYLAARASTLNAHYTSPAIIQNIYQALENMGVEQGNVLEPACGSGNFFGMLPASMSDCQLYGVELDDLTGRIAKQLYPDANISIIGYEKTKYPNHFFDVIVGNVPFGDYKVSDRSYDKHNFSIHDYFIAKGLDQLRPGGVMAVITSSWTMDKKNASARKYFAERANLIGAIRLPDTAFKANAGTEAVTDILFFQKVDQVPDPDPVWLNVEKNIPDTEPIRIGDIVTTSRYDYTIGRQREFEAKVVSTYHGYQGQMYNLQPLDESEAEVVQSEAYVTLKERGEMVYSCNRYFIENPHMVLGEFKLVSGPFGERLTCRAEKDSDLNERLNEAIYKYIRGEFTNVLAKGNAEFENVSVLQAIPEVKNFTYVELNDVIYYRKDSLMLPEQFDTKDLPRVKAMIELRDKGYDLLDAELNNEPSDSIWERMEELNISYDSFVENFGVIHSKENKKLFSKDVTYGFLCSLEMLDENNNVTDKAALFSKRVINPYVEITHVDTANEALMLSLSEKGRVDLGYMAHLLDKNKGDVITDLPGVIFKDPAKGNDDPYSGYVTAAEYLSGNVKAKLGKAIQFAEEDSLYEINVESLRQVQPEPLEAAEIDVRLGAVWIEPHYVEQFMKETFQLPEWRFNEYGNKSERLEISFSDLNGEWNIRNKVVGDSSILATTKYGTQRKNAFHILENCLNLRDSKVYDQIYNPDKGQYESVLNKKETAICNQKAELLKAEFENWIFAEPERRSYLVQKYNDLYNNLRPRQYSGEHLIFPGMNPEVKLMSHQKNAVARTLYGKNTLLAHVVGAGKTYEIAASIMEQRRIGLCNKALVVVPNHLTEQWGREFTDLYPAANILVAKKEDFTPDKRREFCSKIATGDYDAVIIGHTQFEKIPLSVERQQYYIKRQISDIESAINEQKRASGQTFTVKQLEKTEKRLTAKLEKLNNEGKRDNVITFEQLGVDRLYVDESHSYKNLYLHTKMSNVAGVQQTEAQKSTDMYMKCQYMDEISQGRCGIVFASGTPISNSMTELYTNMRYLQADMLKTYGLEQFDAWASTFGNIQTAIELSPEGTNYRAKKRFSSFFNIPELMNLWKESADVQTADMLNLDVPGVTYVNVTMKPTKLQEKMVESLAERADDVRSGSVDPSVDNMLKITNDGRKLALDQRLINSSMPDVPTSKANTCADQAYQIWKETSAEKSAQIIFCDLATPKGDGRFSVYDAIRDKLIKKGVPETEIAYIHEAKTDLQKDRLFKRVRGGEVRFLLGSTAMMGAGTNVQKRLAALHHLDVPWRPSDIEQREGRIIRQGNENGHVKVFRYITSGTFDAYSWQLIENKQRFISQIMTSKSPVRSCSDMDEQSLSYAEVKALATGNPYIKEKMELDISVTQLKMERANHKNDIYRYQDDYTIKYPQEISRLSNRIQGIKQDMALYKENAPLGDDFFIKIGDQTFHDRKEAGERLITAANEACVLINTEHQLGSYLGFKISAKKDSFSLVPQVILGGSINYTFDLSQNPVSNISSITKTLNSLEERVKTYEEKLLTAQRQLEIAREESEKPFPKEDLYQSQLERLNELNALLGISERDENETGVVEDNMAIAVESQKEDNSWSVFTEYKSDDHPEEFDIAPGLDTVEYLVVGGEVVNEDEMIYFNEIKDTYRYMVNEQLLTKYGDRTSLEFVDGVIAQYQGETSISEFSAWLKDSDRGGIAIRQQYGLEANLFVPVDTIALAHHIDDFMEEYDPYNYRDVVGMLSEEKGENISTLERDLLNGNVQDHIDAIAGIYEELDHEDPLRITAQAILNKLNVVKAASINNGDNLRDIIQDDINEMKETCQYMVNEHLLVQYGDRASLEFIDGIIAQYQGENSTLAFDTWLKDSDLGGAAIRQQYALEAQKHNSESERTSNVKPAPSVLAEKIEAFLSENNPGFLSVTGWHDHEEAKDQIAGLLLSNRTTGLVTTIDNIIGQNEELRDAADLLKAEIFAYTGEPSVKKYLSIESTEDYSDENFHSELFHSSVENEDGTYGITQEYYRIVQIGEDGSIVPYNEQIFRSEEAAANIARAIDGTELINYDDMAEVVFQTQVSQQMSPAIEMGSIGNGITVWDRNKPIYSEPNDKKHMVSDYETLAYISPDGSNITWYAHDVSKDVISSIEEIAMKQKEAYDPENLVTKGMDIQQDLSEEPETAIGDLALTDPTYVVEQISHYRTRIDSGGKFISSSVEYADPMDAYCNMQKSYTPECNLYVRGKGNDGEVQAYAINEKQMEKEVIKSVLQLQNLSNNAKDAPPLVRIGFSESAMFGDKAEYMSLFDADNRLAGYNLAAQKLDVDGYEKTDFLIITLKDGELHSYNGQYDIGADSYGLVDHIFDTVKNEMSEENIAMMKAHFKPEEYAAWENTWMEFSNKWLPLLAEGAHIPRSLSTAASSELSKYTEVERYKAEYLHVYQDESVNKNLSLEDKIYTFHQDNTAVQEKVVFKQAALELLKAKALGNGSEYRLAMEISEKEITLLHGSNTTLEMQVEEINNSVNISENSDMKAILDHITETVKPKVVDLYNDLDLSFDEYAAHENDNPWKHPEVMYRASGIPVSTVQETILDILNREFKCYLKPQDIAKISRSGNLRGRESVLKKELLENVQILADRYIEQKPESAAPAPDVGIQLD